MVDPERVLYVRSPIQVAPLANGGHFSPGSPQPTASARWQADVLERKLTIATGAGRVHGRHYAVANWGLGEYPVD